MDIPLKQNENLHFDYLFSEMRKNEERLQQGLLFAHYTTLAVLTKIIEEEAIWLSHPLLMNDHQELNHGMSVGVLTAEETGIQILGDRAKMPLAILRSFVEQFYREFAKDVFIACFCEHDPADQDGILSMWRGYGDNGGGVALILDTTKFMLQSGQRSALLVGKVEYKTPEARKEFYVQKMQSFFRDIESVLQDETKLRIAIEKLFRFIQFYALLCKHSGYEEEKEWRLIHMPDLGIKHPGIKSHYHVTQYGIEPKLILELKSYREGMDVSLGNITQKIILGPSILSDFGPNMAPVSRLGVDRMLDAKDKSQLLKAKVCSSGIPLRRR